MKDASVSTSPRDSALGIPKAPPVDLRELNQSGPTGTNGFAIAALILGALGAVVLAPIFSIVALNQISGGRQTGKGMAIGGLVFTAIWLVVGVAVFIAAVTAPGK
jgi:hypothetical protein